MLDPTSLCFIFAMNHTILALSLSGKSTINETTAKSKYLVIRFIMFTLPNETNHFLRKITIFMKIILSNNVVMYNV